jgi:hypothetical protein
VVILISGFDFDDAWVGYWKDQTVLPGVKPSNYDFDQEGDYVWLYGCLGSLIVF